VHRASANPDSACPHRCSVQIATASSAEKLQICKSKGAKHLILSTEPRMADKARACPRFRGLG
jgi:hypothetical protein